LWGLLALVGALSLQPGIASGAPAKSAAAEPESRVEALLKQLTLEEKLAMVGGTDNFYVRGNERLHVPRLRMADGPLGVRNVGPSTGYAAGIALAASWDTLLAGRIGTFIGHDAHARGVQIMLGPGANIYRAPHCGRNFEYFGEDPYLASRMTVAYIKGVQSQGVSATVKHFLANDSEFDRHGTNAVIDERTLREIYLPPFEAAVREAHVGAVMASYNLINGQHASQNVPLNVDLLKKEWGFDGVLMSDWYSVYDGVAAANAGLDLEMPEGEFMSPTVLAEALRTGKLSLEALDDKIRRILRLSLRFGWLDRDPQQPELSWPLYSQEGRKLALESARASMVLLKNEHGLLPLDDKKLKRLAVIGPDAFPALPAGGGSAQTRPFQSVSFLEGLSTRLAGKAEVTYRRGLLTWEELFGKSVWRTEGATDAGGKRGERGERGLKAEYFAGRDFAGPALTTRVDDHVDFYWAKGVEAPASQKEFSARWTGAFVPEKTGDYRFVATTYGLDTYVLWVDGKVVLDRSQAKQPLGVKVLHLAAQKPVAIKLEYRHHDHHARIALGVRALDAFIDPDAARLAAQAEVAVVFAGFDPATEGEGADRTFALPLDQEELIARVRAANPRTVVVLTSGGGVDMQPWLDKIPALLETWYPGQEGGTALAELLFGDVSPSGKLPVTFERRFEDNAVFKSYYPQKGHGDDHTVTYDEGLFVGYRHFDKHSLKPLFPFGFGLSYTTFKLDHLTVLPGKMEGDGPVTVSCEITNTGTRAGAEVAQIYLSETGAKVVRPVKELKGFAKVTLAPGETQRVSVTLDRRALSTFDVASKTWKATPGTFKVLVGPSSRDLRLFGELVLR
jgi:beta-glucosidase